jgi:hypothetical protein
VGGGARLHADDGDAVREQVVQVAGDPEALLGDPAARLLLAGPLGALGRSVIVASRARCDRQTCTAITTDTTASITAICSRTEPPPARVAIVITQTNSSSPTTVRTARTRRPNTA